jgi:hypothetical protein
MQIWGQILSQLEIRIAMVTFWNEAISKGDELSFSWFTAQDWQNSGDRPLVSVLAGTPNEYRAELCQG